MTGRALMTGAIEILPPAEPPTLEDYARRINARWQESVGSILEVGRLLVEAKAALDHGAFGDLVGSRCPFSIRTAQRLMAIGADQRLANPTHVSHLPPAWGTLYELTRLDDAAFAARISDGTIRPDMERREIGQLVKRDRRQARVAELGRRIAALPAKRYGVILADPEWRFEPRSRESGMDRAADNHYPTSPTEAIAARPVADLAADDCVLWLWATAPMLPQALTVMEAWGFAYKSHAIWRKAERGAAKPMQGTGYWFRSSHELLLVGTRGNVPAPAMGDQAASVIDAPALKHSAKPECFLELIERLYPGIPKIELNRRGAPRPGWDAWGNEAEHQDRNPAGRTPDGEGRAGD